MSNRHRIELTRKAEKDLDDLKQDRDRVVRKLERLRENPQAGHMLTGSLRGTRALEFKLKGGGAWCVVRTAVNVCGYP